MKTKISNFVILRILYLIALVFSLILINRLYDIGLCNSDIGFLKKLFCVEQNTQLLGVIGILLSAFIVSLSVKLSIENSKKLQESQIINNLLKNHNFLYANLSHLIDITSYLKQLIQEDRYKISEYEEHLEMVAESIKNFIDKTNDKEIISSVLEQHRELCSIQSTSMLILQFLRSLIESQNREILHKEKRIKSLDELITKIKLLQRTMEKREFH